jgi:hypothetical protein
MSWKPVGKYIATKMQLKLTPVPRAGRVSEKGKGEHPIQGITPGIQFHHPAHQKSNIPGYAQNQVQVIVYNPWLSDKNTRYWSITRGYLTPGLGVPPTVIKQSNTWSLHV